MSYHHVLIPIRCKDRVSFGNDNTTYSYIFSESHLTENIYIYNFNEDTPILIGNLKKYNSNYRFNIYSYKSNSISSDYVIFNIADTFNEISNIKLNSTLILGYEYLKYVINLKENVLNNIVQLNIEMHQVFENKYINDIDILNFLNQNFYLIYIEPNKQFEFNINKIPSVCRLTYINKKYYKDKKVFKENKKYPIQELEFNVNEYFNLNWWLNKKYKVNKN